MPKIILPNQTNTIVLANHPDDPTIKEKDKNEQISHHFLRQDKTRADGARADTLQPDPLPKVMRARQMNKSFARTQKQNNPKKLVKLTQWVEPILAAQVKADALREGLSVSATLAAITRKHYQAEAHMRYAEFMEPVFDRLFDKRLNAWGARIISLLVRIAYDSGQTRAISTNILGLQPDITPDLLRDILDGADATAKSNITKKTPQIEELIEALNKWFFETNRGENKNN